MAHGSPRERFTGALRSLFHLTHCPSPQPKFLAIVLSLHEQHRHGGSTVSTKYFDIANELYIQILTNLVPMIISVMSYVLLNYEIMEK